LGPARGARRKRGRGCHRPFGSDRSQTQYITNTAAVQCSGKDVVIDGTLLLNNLQIYAEQGGCRMYVTGSVFIEGPITYLSSGAAADPTQNLQISSATSIIMGVGLAGKSYLSGNYGKLNDPDKGPDPCTPA